MTGALSRARIATLVGLIQVALFVATPAIAEATIHDYDTQMPMDASATRNATGQASQGVSLHADGFGYLYDLPAHSVATNSGSRVGADLARAGLPAEEGVSGLLGIPRNAGTGRVTVPGTGPGGYRVPDFDPALTVAQRGTVVEVKDAASLSVTPQLRDLHAFAGSQGVPLEIFTNAPLPSRGVLVQWYERGQLILTPLP